MTKCEKKNETDVKNEMKYRSNYQKFILMYKALISSLLLIKNKCNLSIENIDKISNNGISTRNKKRKLSLK
jgi:hypothetical protein